MSQYKANYYAILPADIRYDKDLPSTAKLLYAEIEALGGNTTASNSYFAEMFGLTETQISSLLNLLHEKKYIKITIKQNYLRKISIPFPRLKYPSKKIKPSSTIQQEWSLENALAKLKNSNRRDLQIIYLWIVLNKFKPQNKEQFMSIINRNIRVAQKLKGYSDEDITETFNILQRTDYIKKITLETITKYIDEVVKNKQNKKPPIKKWIEVKGADGVIRMKPIYN